jgi:hypothetical protein
LSASSYQPVSVTCPNCGNRFVTPVVTVVDAGQNPEAKTLLLTGRLNVAVCPQCGNAGMLSTPLVYHDPEKQILFTFMPQDLQTPEVDQQRIIGELTNQVISSLPSEQRKAYLLQPRSFLRLQGMIEAILEAEGVTPEMLEEQRARASLLERLIQTPGEEARKAIVQENDERIDYEFFELLTLNLELAQAENQTAAVQQLLGLREQLLEWTATGQDIAVQEEAIRSLGTEITREGLLDKLVEAALAGEEAKIEAMVAFARPAIDYVFYQQLTERIEAAQKAGKATDAEALRALRETILDLTAQVDAQYEQATREVNQFLQQILDSDDPEKTIRANLQRVDDLFLGVLTSNLDAARRAQNEERVEQLENVINVVMRLIQESQPPEIRFINDLLTADYPGGTRDLLEENREHLDERMLELMQLVGEDLEHRGREQAAQRLKEIYQQAQALVGA